MRRSWSEEPSSFFGVAFGKPLSASVPECAKETNFAGDLQYKYTYPPDKPCFQSSPGLLLLKNNPAFLDVYVIEVDGKVESIVTSRSTELNDETYNGLVQKFGAPTSTGQRDLQTAAGGTYTDHIARWQGNNVKIVFDSVAGEIDKSQLEVSTRAYDVHLAAEEKSGTKSIANSF